MNTRFLLHLEQRTGEVRAARDELGGAPGSAIDLPHARTQLNFSTHRREVPDVGRTPRAATTGPATRTSNDVSRIDHPTTGGVR
ncbi:hypothetical protein [Nocardia sp. NPDC023988]|uniref:hypothetical protein n=1 Tax=unclassified Nocardia TaxID=2637762 RepID=UPI003411C5FD